MWPTLFCHAPLFQTTLLLAMACRVLGPNGPACGVILRMLGAKVGKNIFFPGTVVKQGACNSMGAASV